MQTRDPLRQLLPAQDDEDVGGVLGPGGEVAHHVLVSQQDDEDDDPGGCSGGKGDGRGRSVGMTSFFGVRPFGRPLPRGVTPRGAPGLGRADAADVGADLRGRDARVGPHPLARESARHVLARGLLRVVMMSSPLDLGCWSRTGLTDSSNFATANTVDSACQGPAMVPKRIDRAGMPVMLNWTVKVWMWVASTVCPSMTNSVASCSCAGSGRTGAGRRPYSVKTSA